MKTLLSKTLSVKKVKMTNKDLKKLAYYLTEQCSISAHYMQIKMVNMNNVVRFCMLSKKSKMRRLKND